LKDEGGTALDAAIAPVGGLVTFGFAGGDFVVSKGTTKKLYVYGNTLACATPSTAQVWFNSADAQNWSINYDAGAYNLGAIIFRGNLYANAVAN